MTADPGLARRPRWVVAVGVGVALAYAALASLTRPFTDGANIVTALPIAVAAVALVVRLRAPRPGPAAPADERGPTGARPWLVWAGAAVAVVGWELYCYTAAPRSEHPTLSTLLDSLDSTHLGKTVAFTLWLALGWYLVRA